MRSQSFYLSLIVLFLGAKAQACGPYFPIQTLIQNDAYFLRLSKIPRLTLAELVPSPDHKRFEAVLAPESPGANQALTFQTRKQTQSIAYRDLEAALASDTRLDDTQKSALLNAFAKLRTKFAEIETRPISAQYAEELFKQIDAISSTLPTEFNLYLQGAISYYSGDFPKAIQRWKTVLELPDAERHFRSVWSAYMLGLAEPKQAHYWFPLVRELAADGFSDNTGLAAASYGWEANAAMDQGNFQRAKDLYLMQANSGYKNAEQSLSILCQRVLQSSPEVIAEAASDPILRILISQKLACDSPSSNTEPLAQKWLSAIEAHPDIKLQEAGSLSVIAYRNGDDDSAKRWLSLSPEEDVLAIWIQSKLALKNGNLEKAKQLLQTAKTLLETQAKASLYRPLSNDISKSLGVLHLTSEEKEKALSSFIEGDSWLDAAYVAETAMTIEELIAYLDSVPQRSSTFWNNAPLSDRLTNLCARRLMRAHRYTDAEDRFPEQQSKKAAQYRQALEKSETPNLDKEQRAKALFEAAVIARNNGIELFATELAPDFASTLGNYQIVDMRLRRQEPTSNSFNKASAEEQKRIAEAMKYPLDRYHYRFIAAQHIWQVAKLLPDEDPRTAQLLAIGGNWIRNIDPQAADPFYKALVIRCGRTRLGQLAIEQKWLPDCEETIEW